jgi:hypothetical protein
MAEKNITELEQLLYHLDRASNIAFILQDNKELGVDMGILFKQLDDYVGDLLEHNEVDLPIDED